MNPVNKAIWYIEHNLQSRMSLDDVARFAGVSGFHLLRAFSAATGLSVMRYVRGRRLTEAARRLATGATNILTVAIDAEYNSHEAFTRAFRDRFGVTPEAVRAQGHVNTLPLVEAITLPDSRIIDMPAPCIERHALVLVAGLAERYGGDDAAARIPGQWQRFRSVEMGITRRVGDVAYGVCYNADDEGNMDYLCGAQVTDFLDLPMECSRLRIAARQYAVFWHGGHISAARSTWDAIWNGWLPSSGHTAADAPLLERYDRRFNWHTGSGGAEFWVPLDV